MEKKGYIPLSDDGKGAIGFRPSLNKINRRLPVEIWFDTGKKMNDGTPRTVCAYDEAQREEYLKRGWKPVPEGFYQGQVEEKEETIIPGSPKRKSGIACTSQTPLKTRNATL